VRIWHTVDGVKRVNSAAFTQILMRLSPAGQQKLIACVMRAGVS
jgi:hypothetical protein